MIAKIVTGASFGGCAAYAYGKDQAEVISHDGIIPDDPKIAASASVQQGDEKENLQSFE